MARLGTRTGSPRQLAWAAAAHPPVRSVGLLHRVSTCQFLRQGARGSLPSSECRNQKPCKYKRRPERCLVLLLPMVSGNGRMKSSRCVSILTTTRRPLFRPRRPRRWPRATRDLFGNASSVHYFGQQAKAAMDEARSAVASLIGADPSEVVFTSGGTEADNFAIRGAADALEPGGRRHLVASAIEHEAILNTLKALARRGWRTTLVPVDQSGIVSPDRLREAMRRRHGDRLGDARQQRDRHDPADRRARRRRARARRADAHRRRAVGGQDSRSTCARSASICCRSRRTSSTARRAPARCGSSAARGCSRS